MNTNYHLKAILAIVLSGAVSLFTGCAKMKGETGVERATKTTTSMETVTSDTKVASLQIDATKATLDDLLKTGQSPNAQPEDVKKSHERFSENVAKMEDIGNKLNKDIDKMHAQGNEYFEGWAKEGGTYTSPEMQKLSEQRRTRLDSSFREMQAAAAGVRPNLNAYLADIKQIQTYLSNDLTAKGISAIVPIAKAAEQDGAKLKKSFIPVQNAIMQARAEMTPGSGAAAGGVQGTEQQQPGQKK
ncbi:MAG: hypothetical protein A2010_19060 [Nitrospirae bacterium GWD2_57_9]|nr:MAG: hypothetical protein A2010_19060 [Nitrospirae bacterium GWD2_57_9]OGW46811.1 MAG: hypothetical protein A2078_15260 [Nitrospirae bacterium GWC2_57_9]